MKKTITDLQQKVQKALSEHSHTEKLAIEVLDDNGVITLMGHVPSRKASKVAESIAKKVPGIISVINMLEIKKENTSDKISNLMPFFRSLSRR